MEHEPGDAAGRVSRRDLLRTGAVLGGALAWSVPVVQTVGMGAAGAQGTPAPCSLTRFEVDGVLPPGNPSAETGQDGYTFEVCDDDTELRVTGAADGSNVDPEIGLFAGTDTTGTNLLNGASFGVNSTGDGGSEVGSAVVAAGTYTAAIEDADGESGESGGGYTLAVEIINDLSGTKRLSPPAKTISNGPETMLVDHSDD